MPDPNTASLLEQLKAQTRDLHLQAERSGVMGDLLARRLSRGAYLALLHNLLALYEALEAAQSHRQDELRALGVDLPDLGRSAALRNDIEKLAAPGRGALPPLEAITETYVQRLQAIDARGLLAHVYLRCLGDLHGGQILAPLLRTLFGLHGDAAAAGLAFYDFGDETTLHQMRRSLREQLACCPVDAAQAQQLVDEARWGFGAHIELFEALQQRCGATTRSA